MSEGTVSPGGSAGRRIAAAVVVAALAGTAGVGFQRVFGLAPIVALVAVAAVLPVLVSLLLSGMWRKAVASGERRPGPLWLTIVVQVVVWFGVVAATLYRGRLADGAALVTTVISAVRDAYRAMLTTILPAPDRPDLLIGAQVIVWVAAFVGAELALRTRTRAAPALPSVAAFGAALLLGVGGPGSNLPVAAAFVALIVVLLVVRSADRLHGLAGGLPSGLAVGLVIAAVAAVAAPYLPASGTPYDPRQHVQAPPPQQRDGVSPLDRVSEWLDNPDQPLFTVRASAAENWRLATLDTFDGATWTSSGHFMPSGSRVPEADPANGGGKGARTTVTQRFTLRNLPGVWLPAADRPRSVTGVPVTVDPDSGVVTAARTLRPGTSYEVTSAARDYAADELARAVPADDAAARAATTLPSGAAGQKVPQMARFQKLAQRATSGASTPFGQAAKLADYLRTHGRYDVKAPPGHTYRHLDFFLNVSHRGTSEQFGTSFAVLARTLGLPTRVVVGFRPGRQVSGVWQVRGGDVLVWPEVDFKGLGWVPFFPTPQRQSSSKRSSSVPVGQTQQKLEKQQKSAETRSQGKGHARRTPRPPPHVQPPRPARQDGVPWWWFAAAAAALAVLAYLAAVALVPALRRRRRRHSPTPATRIQAAWRQAVDHLHDAGLPPTRSMTAQEVAAYAEHRIGDAATPHIRPLAILVNHTHYAPTSPLRHAPGPPPHPTTNDRGTGAGADGRDANWPGSNGRLAGAGAGTLTLDAPPPLSDTDAQAAWHHADELGRQVTHTTGRLRRLAHRLHPRTLRPRP